MNDMLLAGAIAALAVAIVVASGVLILWRAGEFEDDWAATHEPLPRPTTTAPQARMTVQWTGTDGKTATSDSSPQPPLKSSAPVVPIATRQIKLMSGSLRRELGLLPLNPKARKSVVRHRTKDGLISVFVAGHETPEGHWVYRRVGVERES
jgi:hypothetical protein